MTAVSALVRARPSPVGEGVRVEAVQIEIPDDVLDRTVVGFNIAAGATLRSLLGGSVTNASGAPSDPVLVVFLRHYG